MFHLFHPSKQHPPRFGPFVFENKKNIQLKSDLFQSYLLLLAQKSGDHDLGCQTNPVVKKWEKLPTAAVDRQDFVKSSTVPELPNSNPVHDFSNIPLEHILPHALNQHIIKINSFHFEGFFRMLGVCSAQIAGRR